jgi:hypothetical protein
MKNLILEIPEVVDMLKKLSLYDYIHALSCNIQTKNSSIPLHIDYGIFNYSFNLPISGYKNSYINSYKLIDPTQPPNQHKVLGHDGTINPYYYYPLENCELIQRTKTDTAGILEVKHIHNVDNESDETRVFLLFRLIPEFNLSSYINNKEKL